MAFKFFRRNRKLVILIMVALMVVFIATAAFNQLGRGPREGGVYGTTAEGAKITWNDVNAARNDMEILQSLGLGSAGMQFGQMDVIYMQIMGSQAPPQLYAMLLAEADQAKVVVTVNDVNLFFELAGLVGDAYKNFIGEMRSDRNLAEKRIRIAVGNWLRITKCFTSSLVQAPPSSRELRKLYRDLNETIDLQLVKLPGEKYLPKKAEPTPAEIQDMFNRYRNIERGRLLTADSFGFGYRYPNRLRLAYIIVRRDSIERAVRPAQRDIDRYWQEHKDEFVKREPIPATQPEKKNKKDKKDKTPATSTTQTQPVQYKTRQMTFAESEPQIIQQLIDQAVVPRMDDILSVAEQLAAKLNPAEGRSDVYDRVVAEMTLPADKVLAQRIKDVQIDKETLETAMEILASHTRGLRVICFPWGEHEDKILSRSVRVTLKAKSITLGEALANITRQVKWPEINWAMCQGMRGVLFPAGGKSGVDLFPLISGQTKLASLQDLARNELINRSVTALRGGKEMVTILQEFTRGGKLAGGITIGTEGPRVYCNADPPDRMMWRITEFSKTHLPETITKELQEQIVADWKKMTGFNAARKAAEKLRAQAEKKSLAQAAKDAKLEVETTGEFSRKVLDEPYQRLVFLAMRLGRRELFAQAMMSPRVKVEPRKIPKIDVAGLKLHNQLMKEIFSLSPSDPDKPDEPSPVKVLMVPSSATVIVCRRCGYTPALEVKYAEIGKAEAFGIIRYMQTWNARARWFRLESVKERIGFTAHRD